MTYFGSIGVGPSTAGTVKTVGLIDFEKCFYTPAYIGFLPNIISNRLYGRKADRRFRPFFDLHFVFLFHNASVGEGRNRMEKVCIQYMYLIQFIYSLG